MKKHIWTIVLLVLAAWAFALSFVIDEEYKTYCDIIAFGFPTLVAVIEMIVAERSGKELEVEIKKRAIWEHLSQEEFERRKAEGSFDEDTYYATIEEE